MRKKLIVALLCRALAVEPALAACAIDGSTTPSIAENIFSDNPTKTFNVTTTVANDVVILFSAANVNTDTAAVSINGISGGGLSWASRSIITQAVPNCTNPGEGCYFDVEMWWANAPTPLTAASVTITYNAPAHSTFVNIHQFAVSGLANSASPWDVNGSLPASAGVFVPAAAQVIQVPGVSTTNANDFLLWTCFGNIHTGGAAGSNCDWPLYVGAQGWLNISAFYQQNIFTAFFDNSSIWQLPVLATQSSATFTALDPAVSANVNWIASVDALVCVGGSPPPSGTLPHVWVHE